MRGEVEWLAESDVLLRREQVDLRVEELSQHGQFHALSHVLVELGDPDALREGLARGHAFVRVSKIPTTVVMEEMLVGAWRPVADMDRCLSSEDQTDLSTQPWLCWYWYRLCIER
jgi:hypothetical protein